MASEPLKQASELLRDAAAAVADPDIEERIYDQSRKLADAAAADRGPDHGQLARHQNALREIIEAAEGEASDLVAEALEQVKEYRSGVDGV